MLHEKRRLIGISQILLLMLLLFGFMATATAQENRINGKAYSAKTANQQNEDGKTHVGIIKFDKDLFISQDIQLAGAHGYQSVAFSIPRDWDVTEDGTLELHLSHSPSLIADLSSITVIINGKIIFASKLDESNINSTVYVIDIPKDTLKDFNSLELIANQHYMIDCEDPFDPSLVTRIHKDSKIILGYKQKTPEIDLSSFPYPIFEKRGHAMTKVLYLVSPRPSQESLTALTKFQVAFGRDLKWREIDILAAAKAPEELDRHVVIIGTAKESPALRALAGTDGIDALPLPLGKDGKFKTPDGKAISGDKGIIIFTNHPQNPAYSLLILTGNTPKAVEKAVAAITELPYDQTITGNALIVNSVDKRPKLVERSKDTHIPQTPTFTIEDIGFEDVTVRGFFSAAVNINLLMEPDSHPVANDQKFRLVYSYGAQCEKELCSMEIILNGVSIDSRDLAVKEGESHAELLVDLPTGLLAPTNSLVVKFHLFPANYFLCGRVSDRHLWATVHKETELMMPRDYYAYYPNLEFLQHEWFPYSLYQDLQETTIVVNDSLSATDYEALLTIATELGKVTESKGIRIKTYQLSKLPESVKKSDHLILIDSTPRSRLTKTLVGDTKLYYNAKNNRVLETLEDRKMNTTEFASAGIIEQVNSPFNDNRVILLVRGQSTEQLNLALEALTDREKLTQLGGNIAFANKTNEVVSSKTVEKKLAGELPVRQETQTSIYKNFWTIVLLVIAFFILIYILITILRYMKRRKTRRSLRRKDLK